MCVRAISHQKTFVTFPTVDLIVQAKSPTFCVLLFVLYSQFVGLLCYFLAYGFHGRFIFQNIKSVLQTHLGVAY